MKPYFLAFHNILRFSLLKAKCKSFNTSGVSLISSKSKLHISKTANVSIGNRVINDGRMVIIADDNSTLKIGNYVYFNEDAMISCKGLITIGDNCKFGPNVKIFDNNHRFSKDNGVSNEHKVGSVIIGNNCWIATNAVLLKGAKIGDNCVIGANCVINCEIPPASVVTQGSELKITPIRE